MMSETGHGAKSRLALSLLVFLAVAAAFIAMLHPYFSPSSHLVGEDYQYFLPALLNGYFWLLTNGPWAVPWFTPALCAGLPFMPNPQNLYYSVPQAVTLLFSPLGSVYLSVLIFAAAGFWSFHFLCRYRFHMSATASLFAGTAFLFNGFFAHRMLAGHLTFHAYMLVPAVAACLLGQRPPATQSKLPGLFLGAAGAAVMLAYMLLAGGAVIFGPSLLCIVGIWLLAELHTGRGTAFWPRFGVAMTLSLCLAAFKLAPAYAYLSQFPRDLYPVPGFATFRTSLMEVPHMLFSAGSYHPRPDLLVNSTIVLRPHEFEYSVTPVPLFVFLTALMVLFLEPARQRRYPTRPGMFQLLRAGAAILLFLIPVVMNTYSPVLDRVIKELPYLKSTFLFLRWIVIDIPMVILAAAMILDRINTPVIRSCIAAAGMAGIVAINLTHAGAFERYRRYDPRHVTKSYLVARQRGTVPPVTRVQLPWDGSHRAPNDRFVDGISALPCYQPIFGYRLETFPRGDMRFGSVIDPSDRQIRMRNPACYVFGKANHCRPGDYFNDDERGDALAFTHYRQFPFQLPWWQRVAGLLSLASFVLVLVTFTWSALKAAGVARTDAR